ncbi:MAG: Gfo/Idh/MocA family oxidoreductase [Sphaerochaeta sp.]|jgi:predicted dehydrogenase|nr:Gfo/Idh/MocA family oxidoreductase [Sphaerochaeta sp.]
MNWQPSDAVREVLEKPILVIGAGSIGQRHIRNLLELGANDVYIYDQDEPMAIDWLHRQDKLNGAKVLGTRGMGTVWQTLRQFAIHPVAAIICTPTQTHIVDILDCIAAGVNALFIEKPLCNYAAFETDTKPLEEIKTFVACNFRFTQGLQCVKKLIDDGAIGKVVSARAQFGQYLPDMRPGTDHRKTYAANRSMGGGCLLDGIHEFDYLSWLLGPIAEAKAYTARLTDVTNDTEDVAEAILHFESGALGSVHEDYLLPGYERRLELWCTNAKLCWGYEAYRKYEYVAAVDGFVEFHPDVNDMYLAEMQHFLRVCAGEEKSCNTVADAYRLLEVVLKARE